MVFTLFSYLALFKISGWSCRKEYFEFLSFDTVSFIFGEEDSVAFLYGVAAVLVVDSSCALEDVVDTLAFLVEYFSFLWIFPINKSYCDSEISTWKGIFSYAAVWRVFFFDGV